jgi:RNA polymerase sigma factor (sigma-70 family)
MATGEIREVIRHVRGEGPTDGQLLEDYVIRGDGSALAALVRRHGPMVWGVCRRVLANHHDAEDAFQAAFLVLVRKASSIASRALVANWLYGVAYQTAMKARTTAAKRGVRERQVAEMPEPGVVDQDPWHDLWPLLDRELSLLPDRYRVPIVLCDLEGKTRKEAARLLRVPEGTVAGRLARARALLAKRLTRHGLALTGGTIAVVLARNVASAGVPPAVVSATIRAVGGAAPAEGAALTDGVLRNMLLTRLKTITLLTGLLAAVVGLGASAYDNRPAPQPPSGKEPAARAAAKADVPEPDYRYCRLVFGPSSKMRALVRFDGEAVAIDRDNDGKFDGKGERFASEKECKGVVLHDADGKTSYVVTEVADMHVVPPEKFVYFRVHVRGDVEYHQSCIVDTSRAAADAPEVHFHGPLTVAPKGWRIANRAARLLENDLIDLGRFLPQSVRMLAGKELAADTMLPKSLARGDQPAALFAVIATEGNGAVVNVCSPGDTDEDRREKSPLPKGVQPFVDVEFPAKKQGDPPVKKRYPLDVHVVDGLFKGTVPVPESAGGGKAKVTFSLDAWKGMKVAPTTVEITVPDPPAE